MDGVFYLATIDGLDFDISQLINYLVSESFINQARIGSSTQYLLTLCRRTLGDESHRYATGW